LRGAAVRFGLVMLLAGLAAGAPARADEVPLRFAVPALPIWAQSRVLGEPAGVAVDVVRLLMSRAGVRGTIRALPIARILSAEDRGGWDFAILARQPDDGPDEPKLLAKIAELSWIVVARPGRPLKTMDDLPKLGRIAAFRGVIGTMPLLTGMPGVRIEEVSSVLSGLRMLAAGRVDAVTGSDIVIDALASHLGIADRLGDRLFIAPVVASLAASDAQAETPAAEALKTAAEELVAEGAIQRMIDTALRDAVAAAK
jgi:ABC-type amino acid transport substrate-binding protein